MTVTITVDDNEDIDSPGVDFTISGLGTYTDLLLERIDLSGEYPITPVRAFDHVEASATMAGTDFEAPINKPLEYRVTASGANPDIQYFGAGAFSVGATSVLPTYPGSLGTEDISILTVSMKPYTATMSTPSGWTLLHEHTNGSVASGLDTGSVKMYSFYREGSAVGSVSITPSGCNVVAAQIFSFRKAAAGAWTVTATEGDDTTHGANFLGGSTTSMSQSTPGDILFAAAGVNTNGGTPTNILLELPNSGVGTTNVLSNEGYTDGDDGRYVAAYVDIGVSTASGQPKISWTNSTNSSGTVMFVRLSATGTSSETVTSAEVTIGYDSFGDAWIKSVAEPALSRRVAITGWNTTGYSPRILGNYKILGRPRSVILTDRWGAREGEIEVCTDNDFFSCTWQDLNLLVIEGRTLFFQSVGSEFSGEKDMYFEVLSFSRVRSGPIRSDGKLTYLYKIQFEEVDRPATHEESLGLRSYQDVIDENATYQSIIDNYPDPDDTYLALLISEPS